MATTGDAPITVYIGLDYSETFVFSDITTGDPIDLSARTFAAQLRYDVDSDDADLTFTCTAGGGTDNNELLIQGANADTEGLTAKSAQWLLIETTAGLRVPMFGGIASIVNAAAR